MNKTATEAVSFVHQFSEVMPQSAHVEVVLAPPFTALDAVRQAAGTTPPFGLAGQNIFWEEKGPFTGEISAPMLKDIGCRYVIIGHSERRQWFGDTDEGINKKVRTALRHGLHPVLCVGESLADRESGRTHVVVTDQIRKDLDGLSKEEVLMTAIAYEPVWAIGTGRAATSVQAIEIHQMLRALLSKGWGSNIGDQIRILYGGSVTPENVGTFVASPDVDGVLVGGACLDPQGFAKIIAAVQKARESS